MALKPFNSANGYSVGGNIVTTVIDVNSNFYANTIQIPYTGWIDFVSSDTNWRMGYKLEAYTKTIAINTIDVEVGSNPTGPDGFTVGQAGGTSIFELDGYTKDAYFANNVQINANANVGTLRPYNIYSTGGMYDFSNNQYVNLGDVGNINIQGGSANYVLTTDGAGHLSWQAGGGGGGGLMPFYIPVGTTYVIGQYEQGLFSLPIEVAGTLQVDGILVQVSQDRK